MSAGGEIEADMLFLGLTRSPTLFGVSYNVVVMNFFVCMIWFVAAADLFAFLVMPLFHGIAYLLSSKEPLFLELFMVKQGKCNRCKNKFYHGMTNSYDVF